MITYEAWVVKRKNRLFFWRTPKVVYSTYWRPYCEDFIECRRFGKFFYEFYIERQEVVVY